MAASKYTPPKNAELTFEQLKAAIPKIDRRINDLNQFDVSIIESRWNPKTEALEQKINSTLQEILGHDTIEYREYSCSLDTLPLIMGGGSDPLPYVQQGYRDGISHATQRLQTLKELFEERIADTTPEVQVVTSLKNPVANNSKRVFIVHGHDNLSKETVARHLSKLKLDPIILHEQVNQGKTIIEKFEANSDVCFAVVLITPDDVGYPTNNPNKFKSRARQNVILELGFFMGKLGRNKVCVLHKGDVEFPSDYSGIVYIPLDEAGAWKFLVAREMKSAGLDIDLNNVT